MYKCWTLGYYGVADVCRISKDGVKDAVWHTFCSLIS